MIWSEPAAVVNGDCVEFNEDCVESDEESESHMEFQNNPGDVSSNEDPDEDADNEEVDPELAQLLQQVQGVSH